MLLLFPLALAGLNDTWTYMIPQGIDPYLYTGYFQHLQRNLNDFGPLYYGSRLPWLLLGNLFYTNLTAHTAEILMRFLLFYAGIFAMYSLVASLWRSRSAGLLAAVLLGAHVYFLQSISWNYVDGPAVVMVLVCMALAAAAIDAPTARRRNAWLFACGVAVATTVSIQLFMVVFMPLLLLGDFAIAWHRKQKVTDTNLLSLGLGAGAALLFYALVNVHLVGRLNYLAPQIHAANVINLAVWKQPVSTWIDGAGWLVFPAAAGIVALLLAPINLYLTRIRRQGISDGLFILDVCAVQLLALLVAFAYFQWRSGAVLQLSWYASLLIPFAFLVFAGCLVPALGGLKLTLTPLLGLLAAVVMLAPFATSLLRFGPQCNGYCLKSTDLRLMFAAVILLLALTVLLRRPAAVLLLLVVFSLLNISTVDRNRIAFANVASLHARQDLVFAGDSVIERYDHDTQLKFWYSAADPFASVYAGMSSLRLWGPDLISEDFPKRTSSLNGSVVTPRPGQTIAVLTNDPQALNVANQTLEKDGVDARLQLVSDSVISRAAVGSFHVMITAVLPAAMTPSQDIDLGTLVTAGGAQSSGGESQAVRITAPSSSRQQVATLPVPALPSDGAANTGYVAVKITTAKGSTSVRLLSREGRTISQQNVGAADGPVTAFLKAPSLTAATSVALLADSGATIQLDRVTLYSMPPAPCPCTIWPPASAPANISPSTAPSEFGLRFHPEVDGFILGVRFYKGPGNLGTHVAHLWTSTGSLLAQAIYTQESPVGWQEVRFAEPVPVTANTSYVASYFAPQGGFAFDDSYFARGGEGGGLVQADPSRGARNGLFSSGLTGFPTQSYRDSNYWVDVVFSPGAVNSPVSGCPCSLWNDQIAPPTPAVTDGNPWELGLRFHADTDGLITGVRFFKGPGNDGSHVAHLWSDSGQLLAEAKAAQESPDGWQSVTFATPVRIEAGKNYVASYFDPKGHFAYDPRYFASSSQDSGGLHAARDGTAGSTGVYHSGSSGFPTSSSQGANYWVDVVFSPQPPAGP